MEDSDWRSANFRQKLVSQIEEAMRKAGVAHTKTSKEMENHVFMKAKTRDEYLSLVARLIIHFRDIHNKKSLASVSDPMNALQNLTGGPPAGPGSMGMASRPQGASLAGMSGLGAPMGQQMNLPGQQPPGHGIPNIPAGSQPTQLQLQQMAAQQQQQQQQFQQQQQQAALQQQQQQQFQAQQSAMQQQQQFQAQVQQQQQQQAAAVAQQQMQAVQQQQQQMLKLQLHQQSQQQD